MSFAERRRCARAPCHSQASLSLNTADHPGIVVDISMWGALFSSHVPATWPVDQDCRLDLLDPANRLTLTLKGLIVHAEHRQAGILFRGLDGRTVGRLKRLTESRFRSAALLHGPLPALLR